MSHPEEYDVIVLGSGAAVKQHDHKPMLIGRREYLRGAGLDVDLIDQTCHPPCLVVRGHLRYRLYLGVLANTNVRFAIPIPNMARCDNRQARWPALPVSGCSMTAVGEPC